MTASRPPVGRAVALGVVAGFLSGLFGVGGGILIVPVLVLLMHVDQRLAHGTSLAAVLPIAASGVIGFALDDSVDWPVAVALVAGALGGALVGTHALRVLSTTVLARAFALLLLGSAIRLVFEHADDAVGRGELDGLMVAGLVTLGFASGTLAGLLGVGGGVIMVPAMIILLAIPAAVAKGTSLAVIIPTSMVATWRNRANDNVDLGIAVAIGLAGVASAYAASKISVGLDEAVSNGMFAALLTFVAARMLWRDGRRGGVAAPTS